MRWALAGRTVAQSARAAPRPRTADFQEAVIDISSFAEKGSVWFCGSRDREDARAFDPRTSLNHGGVIAKRVVSDRAISRIGPDDLYGVFLTHRSNARDETF